MKMFIIIPITLWCWLLLALWVLILIPFSLLMAPFPQRYRTPFLGTIWQIQSWILLKIGFFARLRIEDRRDKNQRKRTGLFAGNHQNAMDIGCMAVVHPVGPIMKAELARLPFFGMLARIAGAIPVDRGKMQDRKRVFTLAQERLKQGIPLQVYPEGTRSLTGEPYPIRRLHRSLIDFCFREKIPVTPISIFGSRETFKKGLCYPGKKVGIITHKTLLPQDFSSEDAFLEAVWGTVVGGYEEMKNNYSSQT